MRGRLSGIGRAGRLALVAPAVSNGPQPPLPTNRVTMAPGVYGVTGTDVAVLHTWKVAAAGGSYAVTGSTAATVHRFVVAAAAGSYGVTGSTVFLAQGFA